MPFNTSLDGLRTKILTGELSHAELRTALIELIQKNSMSTAQLKSIIKLLRESTQNLFDEHSTDAYGKPSTSHLEWNSIIFDKEAKISERNFSYERLSNLIAMKEYLRQQNIKGHSLQRDEMQHEGNNNDEDTMSTSTTSTRIDENLQQQVATGKPIFIGNALLALLADNTIPWSEVSEAEQWATGQVPNLFAQYEEANYAQPIASDKSSWDSNYYYNQEVYFTANLSKKRWDHLVAVRKHLSELGTEHFVRKPAASINRPQERQRRSETYSHNKQNASPSFSLAKIGGVVMALIAAVAAFLLMDD